MSLSYQQYTAELFWTKFPENFSPSPSYLGFLSKTHLLDFLQDIKKPTFIYTGTNSVEALESAKYSQDIIDKLNETGIDIYFYEPLCFRISEHNRFFYTEFTLADSIDKMHSDELDSVEKFRIKNKIQNINVYTTEYNIHLVQDVYPNIKLHCFDVFLESLEKIRKHSIGNLTKSKKFWCANWRYAPHRHIVTSYLVNTTGTYSWNLSCSIDTLRENIWFDLDKLEKDQPLKFKKLKNGVEILESRSFSIDQNTKVIGVNDLNNVYLPGLIAPLTTDRFFESYKDCFCAVVNETRFAQPFANISEKTINALRAKLPIILVAPPRSLEYVRSFGYKTFNQWWDESYDLEEDHETRMLMILDIIDYINSKSIDELNSMYQEMYPTLEYNEQIGRISRSYTPAIYWTNFPEINNFKSKNLGFLITTQLRLGFLKNVAKPTIIYTGTNYIYELEQAEYDQEMIDYLNTVGLDIYFYEPLCFRDSTSHNRSFYSEFFSDTPISTILCDEFDSLDYFCRKNNLTNVNVYSGEYKIQLLQNSYPRFKLNCFDIFIRSLDHKHQYNVLKSNIKKKFWCGNWRYATHRHLITSYLATYDGVYSWHIKCTFEKLRDNIWFDIDKLELFEPELFLKLKSGSDLLEKNTFTIDKNNPAISVEDVDSVHIPGNVAPLVTDTFIESYADCFCAVINETRFAQPFANISEKTLNPIRAKVPLILVGPPYSLEYLKTFGFKTFDRWWDESYDLEEDHETRMLMIFKLIDYINSKSLDELNVIYQEMEEILEHNFNIVKSYKQMNLNFTIL